MTVGLFSGSTWRTVSGIPAALAASGKSKLNPSGSLSASVAVSTRPNSGATVGSLMLSKVPSRGPCDDAASLTSLPSVSFSAGHTYPFASSATFPAVVRAASLVGKGKSAASSFSLGRTQSCTVSPSGYRVKPGLIWLVSRLSAPAWKWHEAHPWMPSPPTCMSQKKAFPSCCRASWFPALVIWGHALALGPLPSSSPNMLTSGTATALSGAMGGARSRPTATCASPGADGTTANMSARTVKTGTRYWNRRRFPPANTEIELPIRNTSQC